MKRVVQLWWAVGVVCACVLLAMPLAQAADEFPDQQASGSVGLQGTIASTPPTRPATITTPGNGATFTTSPITINGICPANSLVKIFSNNVFIGSVLCVNGSYSMQVSLFSGQNEIIARVYDALDQAGPDSNLISVFFNDGQLATFGTRVGLSTPFAQRGAPPGQELTWPITITGGTGPYAVSVDWGDGSPTDLFSQETPGNLTLKHTYKSAGVYRVIIKVTDKNGTTAFLQVVGQATGAGQSTAQKPEEEQGVLVQRDVLWWPALTMFPLILAAFWVGRRHELMTLRRQLEKSRASEKR